MLSLLLRSLQKCLDVGHMYFIRGEGEQEEVSFFFFCSIIFIPFPFFPLLLGEFSVRSRLPVCLFFFYSYYYLFIYNRCYLSFSDSAVLHSEGGVLSLVPGDAYVSHRRPPAVTPLDRFQMG